ncbi:hypothetical protein HYDPIDRAFT_171172 [Hydnomerulius pinastri MD-312]|uniref:CxC2-like cysteine cluster KDZ transposase-associated domain-containing protein n=1 Tax=Hydnomerulius pinastri MD-312 TaxID=994086 RepID=A0A0C9W7B0_9AGAM|nr:hypothetical protein HYDPIDRAFT_171172 [Hydnomerulius pinastri MD-312]
MMKIALAIVSMVFLIFLHVCRKQAWLLSGSRIPTFIGVFRTLRTFGHMWTTTVPACQLPLWLCSVVPPAAGGCERYEPDEEEMRALWNHELDANDRENQHTVNILARFYCLVSGATCNNGKCDGLAIMKPLIKGHSKSGKSYFIGCSKWSKEDDFKHLHFSIPINVVEDELMSVLQSGGQHPLLTMHNDKCALTVHPWIGLTKCLNCPNLRKAIVVLRNPHNHPMHPHTKPTFAERHLMTTLNAAQHTSTAEKSVMRSELKRKRTFQRGWGGWGGKHTERESKLPLEQRYIHTVMSKGDIKLAVTMHPAIAALLHSVTYLCINFTFKCVAGEFNEWEIAGFSDHFKQRLTLSSLYCNRATREAFYQLFTEFMDTIRCVTGKALKIRAFDEDAVLHCFIFDAEVAQVQGFGDWLVQQPQSKLSLMEPLGIVHGINELPNTIPLDVIEQFKGFPELQTIEEINKWHEFCWSITDQSVQTCTDWYQQRIIHPWFLPSLNGFLSPMDPESWKLTPSHTNIAETAHAARNAETSMGVSLLTAILQARERDVKIAEEIAMIEHEGVMPHQWNGTAEQEKRNVQRQACITQKTSKRDTQLGRYDELQVERAAGATANKDSLTRQKVIQEELVVAPLKDGGLSGARLNRHHKAQRPPSSATSSSEPIAKQCPNIPPHPHANHPDPMNIDTQPYDQCSEFNNGASVDTFEDLGHSPVLSQTYPMHGSSGSMALTASGLIPFNKLDTWLEETEQWLDNVPDNMEVSAEMSAILDAAMDVIDRDRVSGSQVASAAFVALHNMRGLVTVVDPAIKRLNRISGMSKDKKLV